MIVTKNGKMYIYMDRNDEVPEEIHFLPADGSETTVVVVDEARNTGGTFQAAQDTVEELYANRPSRSLR